MNPEILKQGIVEFVDGGLDEEAKGRFRLAATAYFKALTRVCDYVILKKTGILPSSHAERFRILEAKFKQLYLSADRTFGTYRDTYSMPVDKMALKTIKNEIAKIIESEGLEKELKGISEKIRG